jgi:hypothetical protein
MKPSLIFKWSYKEQPETAVRSNYCMKRRLFCSSNLNYKLKKSLMNQSYYAKRTKNSDKFIQVNLKHFKNILVKLKL